MSDNYEMAAIISDALALPKPGEKAMDSIRVADRLAAAGYSKQRIIVDAEGLGALANGSILMSGDRIKRYEGALWRVNRGMVVLIGRELDGVTPFAYFKDPLPAAVLHEPSAMVTPDVAPAA